jgi:hypothetical protein
MPFSFDLQYAKVRPSQRVNRKTTGSSVNRCVLAHFESKTPKSVEIKNVAVENVDKNYIIGSYKVDILEVSLLLFLSE